MTYKYNIKHKTDTGTTVINFKSKKSMISFLDTNTTKINKMKSPTLNFGAIALPLKNTIWFNQ